ncbi:type III-B CRISPR-associated protein Cas10/Cmr2, partial [Methanoregula sp.]|uniref:type III-B CRISPR-associated protein Cas10/Cmr2 n=1 Tax=Methanoregula sp. TaxID=2052170 RepID=UPI003BB1A399
ANIILVELPEGNDPREINKHARDAARKRWRTFADPAKKIANDVVDDKIWNEQIDNVIEFYAAWVPSPNPEKYGETRARLMRLLAARKSTRDFRPAPLNPGLEKSSLDGARESVLKKGKTFTKDLIIRMRLKEREQLCAVGLTKRLGSGDVSFPSVVRVAADRWIREIMTSRNDDAIQVLEQIAEWCKKNPNIASRYSGTLYGDFPYDSGLLYPARLEAMKRVPKERKKERSWIDYLDQSDRNDLTEIKRLTERLQKRGTDEKVSPRFGFGEPSPYLAILVADGDQMGKAISSIRLADEHRKFSYQLSQFAKAAKPIVEGEIGHGCVVYTGGDDVLAFLPVDTCIATARALHEKFGELLEGFPTEAGKTPTLSVGIAIVHSLDPLEDILNYGRDAEHAAKKPNRDGLAVHLHTRNGGEPTRIREQWIRKDPETGADGAVKLLSLDKRLNVWVKMYHDDDFPDGAAYDLRQLAEDYKAWKSPIPPELLKKDVLRLIRRKRAGSGKREIDEKDIPVLVSGIHSHEHLTLRAEELVLARRIADITRKVKS